MSLLMFFQIGFLLPILCLSLEFQYSSLEWEAPNGLSLDTVKTAATICCYIYITSIALSTWSFNSTFFLSHSNTAQQKLLYPVLKMRRLKLRERQTCPKSYTWNCLVEIQAQVYVPGHYIAKLLNALSLGSSVTFPKARSGHTLPYIWFCKVSSLKPLSLWFSLVLPNLLPVVP